MPEPLLSVVIPVGPEEIEISPGLLEDLFFLPRQTELIFVLCEQSPLLAQQAVLEQQVQGALSHYPQIWLSTRMGRAAQMNAGAAAARGEFLWFLHLDSRFQPQLIDQFVDNLTCWPQRLHYSLLRFSDGPARMPLNGLGANLRSLLLGVPFGDQGLAVHKDCFAKIGGYPEADYGEDHLFVWYARQQGIKLKCCFNYLSTSARKYENKGWLQLTCLYQKRWLTQAWPEFLKLLRQRYL